MSKNSSALGHLFAIFTIFIWGTTFISTKMLLSIITPMEILFFRFSLGLIALLLFTPKHKLFFKFDKQELYFAGAGLTGITLYFLFENIALIYSYASNVSIILCLAPFFASILSFWFLKSEKLGRYFFLGFTAAIVGITLISFNGSTVLHLNPLGDILALLAALVWGIYSVLVKKLIQDGFPAVLVTKKAFVYGLLFMVPCLPFFPFSFSSLDFHNPVLMFNLAYLGLGASALCFAIWNLAVDFLGVVKTSAYIYLTPVVTIIFAAFLLNERLTLIALAGSVLTLIGLILSEKK